MRRVIVLGTVIAISAVSLAAVGLQQGPPLEVPKVVEAQKIADSLYMLTGPGGASKDTRDPSGGNVAAFITTTGVVVVDAKNPG